MSDFFAAENLLMQFGGLTAVNAFSLSLEPGELVALIGPNGAGKTTVFNMITGAIQATSGRVIWQGDEITRLPVDQITSRGIARTFQNIRLFSNLNVIENVMVSFHRRLRSGFLQAMMGFRSYSREERRIQEQAYGFLEELGLAHFSEEKASNLPYGQQRRLEIARALATNPKLLLLDEPAAGMNPQETQELADLIRVLRKKYRLTILLIEHDMKFVMRLCERIKVLEYGISIAEGTPVEIQNDPNVIKAYLGTQKHV